MGNIESNNSHEQNFSEVQKIQDVLNMNTETFVSQRGNGFNKGDRIINIHTNKKGTIDYLRDDETEKRLRLKDPSRAHYLVSYDDGSHETYESGYNLKYESGYYPKSAYLSGEKLSPGVLVAKFHIGQRVAVTGQIGFLVPMGDYKQVYGKRGAITKINTTAPIGKVIYNVLFDDGTAGGEVWEEYILEELKEPTLSETLWGLPSASPAAPVPKSSPRSSPAAPKAPKAPASRASPAAPKAPASSFDALGYCSALMSAPDMPEMSGDDITKGLCAALMKK